MTRVLWQQGKELKNGREGFISETRGSSVVDTKVERCSAFWKHRTQPAQHHLHILLKRGRPEKMHSHSPWVLKDQVLGETCTF